MFPSLDLRLGDLTMLPLHGRRSPEDWLWISATLQLQSWVKEGGGDWPVQKQGRAQADREERQGRGRCSRQGTRSPEDVLVSGFFGTWECSRGQRSQSWRGRSSRRGSWEEQRMEERRQRSRLTRGGAAGSGKRRRGEYNEFIKIWGEKTYLWSPMFVRKPSTKDPKILGATLTFLETHFSQITCRGCCWCPPRRSGTRHLLECRNW